MPTSATPVQLVDPATGNPYMAGGGGGGAATIADGADVATGARSDAAWSGTGNGTVVSVLKAIWTSLTRLGASFTDRSGTATTTSGGLTVAANASRRLLVGQNVSAVNIGYHEFGGVAAIGSAGTYTVPPGTSFSISTPNAVNFIAASGTAAVTLTETT